MSEQAAKQTIGVLVMSYGTPASMEHIEEYYTHIRRGNPPSAEQLADLTSRYEAIVGGVFPLREHTDRQVSGLEQELAKQDDGIVYRCYQGLRHAQPFIEDGVKAMAADGIKRAVGIVLAPHYSVMSVGGYIKRAEEAAQEMGIEMSFVKSYHLHPLLIQALSERVNASLTSFDVPRDQVRVLYTAHSLPEKILEMKDPYPAQLLETAKAVAEKVDHSNWQFAWQSAGQTGTPWLGPDVLDVIRELREQEQIKHVLVCPVGFVSDHLEVLYDLDIEAKQAAAKIGMQLERTAALNTDPLYMQTLADSVRQHVQALA